MADFITPVFNILTCLSGCCSKWAYSIRNLRDNLELLKNDSEELNGRYLDVKMRAETAENNPELMVLNGVRNWMGRVEVLHNEVNAILQQGDGEIQAKCFGGHCPKNCWASYKLSKMVTKKLSVVKDLTSKGHFDVVVEKCIHYQFQELPIDKIVGEESTFEELCSCFQDNEVGIIGLYGMGGVGKTTLLKKFNNDFLSTRRDYVVIWVVASKGADPQKIQDDIRKKLCVPDDIWNEKTKDDDKALLLYNILKKKKFVLLLDDVWERINLLKLGVPSPDNHKCKIIFTTRLYEVCGQMDAKRSIGVKCLTKDKAFDLFKEKVGETIFESRDLDLAIQVIDECQGLPLALCVVGRAMSTKATRYEWERALEILRSHPSKMQGIDDVFYLLEFSYDKLPDTYKPCFLYCSLFPEDYYIKKEELILMWIAEGFLAGFDFDIHEARKEGEDIISSLKNACLLEDGEKDDTIKMHDVIRDMALWVACDHEKKTRFLVKDSSNTSCLQIYNSAKRDEVEKLSFWGNTEIMTNYFSQNPSCPNLVTLLIRQKDIGAFFLAKVFSTDVFLRSNTIIRVLDLSGSRGIRDLSSTIRNLVNLQHMNLSYTGITNLPKELKNLKELSFFLLDGLNSIRLPEEVICGLLSLQAFSARGSTFSENVEKGLLNGIEGLDHIQDIRICVSLSSSVKKILRSSKLRKCMHHLHVQCIVTRDLFLELGKMEHLESLAVVGTSISEDTEAANIASSSLSRKLEQIIMLRHLCLKECDDVFDLNWLIHTPNLKVLELFECNNLEEVISDDTEVVENNLFSNLTSLHLEHLNNLKSICRMPLKFPSLKEIQVIHCPYLQKLPFNSQSDLKNLQRFIGNRGCFHQLQWEDDATKVLVSSKFRETVSYALYRRPGERIKIRSSRWEGDGEKFRTISRQFATGLMHYCCSH